MGATKRALFERCPLCHKGVVEIVARRASSGTSFAINPCSSCGAIFSPGGDGRFRLGYCNPRKLAAVLGKGFPRGVCVDCVPFADCLIGKALYKTEWDAFAKGEAIEMWGALVEEVEELEDEFPTVCSPEPTFVPLVEDEVVHHESTVYLSEVTFAGALRDEAQLFLTSRRIVIVHQSVIFDIRLADVERVEATFPGFVIRARSVDYPLYFLPVPGDPVYHAILGALKKVH